MADPIPESRGLGRTKARLYPLLRRALQWNTGGRWRGTVMRHFSLSLAVAALALGMGEAATTALLVAPAGAA